MPMFRKKPVVIEAFQVPQEDEDCTEEMAQFLRGSDRNIDNFNDGSIWIHTLEGTMMAHPGDWIIKGVAGEFYPCKPDIFDATYDAVSGDETGDSGG